MSKEIKTTAIIEEYLEAILNLSSENKMVIGARLAERLQNSPPTVTVALQRMKRDGLVITGKRKEVLLTKKGRKLAIDIVRRHRLAECLLTDIINVPWSEVHQEACLLEHGISEKVMSLLYKALGKPAACPHGNPIPVDDFLPPLKGIPLNSIRAGSTAVIERISEEASQLRELMEHFEQAEIKPGIMIKVKEVSDYAGTITLTIKNKPFTLGTGAAAMVWVTPITDI